MPSSFHAVDYQNVYTNNTQRPFILRWNKAKRIAKHRRKRTYKAEDEPLYENK